MNSLRHRGLAWGFAGWLALASLVLGAAPGEAPVAAAGVAAEFSPAGGVFTDKVSVQLSAPSGDVRYTIDGSEPSAKSPSAGKALTLRGTTRLRAQVFERGRAAGPARSQTYVVIEKDLEKFTSNLPLVILNTFGRSVDRHVKQPVATRFIDVRNGRSSLVGPADFDGGGLISYRGNSSLRYLKRSYAYKSLDEAGRSLNAPILGFPEDSDWVLYAPYPDKTLLRDVLAYEMFNQMGHYTSRTKFVEVFVNESGGRLTERHYRGVFVLEEKIKRSKDRVNLVKLGTNDNTAPSITGGYIFKKDHPDRTEEVEPTEDGVPHFGGTMSGLKPGYPTGPGGFPADPSGFLAPGTGRSSGRTIIRSQPVPQGGGGNRSMVERLADFFSPAPTPQNRSRSLSASRPAQPTPGGMFREYSPGYGEAESGEQFFVTPQRTQFFYIEPKQEDITPAQKRWLLNHLSEFERVLYGPGFADPARGYAAWIDVDTFIDQHLIVEVTKNIDGFRFSTFFSKDRGGKIRMEPIWDWNLSFGNANGKQGWIAEYWYWPQLDDQQYSWFRRLFEDPDFGQRYVDRWGQLRTNVLSTVHIHGRIDAMARHLGEAQRRNFERWPILGKRIWPNTYVGRSYEDEISWMKNWIARRIAWIDQQFVAAPTLTLTGANRVLNLSARAGQIYYTLDGSDPRQPGGAVSPRAQIFRGAVNLPTGARVFARALINNHWSPPAKQVL